MTKSALFGAATVALMVAGAAPAGSTRTVATYKAALAPGAEVPKATAPATARGQFTATVSEDGAVRTIRWTLTFRGLSGKAVAAHIHKGRRGVAGGVILPLCGPCKTGRTGRSTISRGTADALAKGLAYVNVHTGRNPAGEIRGQIELVRQNTTPSSEPDPVITAPPPAPGEPPGGGTDIPPGY